MFHRSRDSARDEKVCPNSGPDRARGEGGISDEIHATAMRRASLVDETRTSRAHPSNIRLCENLKFM